MTQSEVRQMFIRANPGVKRPGKKGLWYRCAHCGKWCGRSGGDGVNIPLSDRIRMYYRTNTNMMSIIIGLEITDFMISSPLNPSIIRA